MDEQSAMNNLTFGDVCRLAQERPSAKFQVGPTPSVPAQWDSESACLCWDGNPNRPVIATAHVINQTWGEVHGE